MNMSDALGPDTDATEERLSGEGGAPLLVSGGWWAVTRCPLCGRTHRVEVRPLVEGDYHGQIVVCERTGATRRVDLWLTPDFEVEVELAEGTA